MQTSFRHLQQVGLCIGELWHQTKHLPPERMIANSVAHSQSEFPMDDKYWRRHSLPKHCRTAFLVLLIIMVGMGYCIDHRFSFESLPSAGRKSPHCLYCKKKGKNPSKNPHCGGLFEPEAAYQECSNLIPIVQNDTGSKQHDCFTMMLVGLRVMAAELKGKIAIVGGTALEWYRSCTLGINDHDIDIGLFPEQWQEFLKMKNIVLREKILGSLREAKRHDLVAVVDKGFWPQRVRPEYFEAQSRLVPAKVYLPFPSSGANMKARCALDIWVLHRNGSHMARYGPRWRRAWVTKVRPLHLIVLEGVTVYAQFPMQEYMLDEFGPSWATPVNWSTWNFESKANPSRRMPTREMTNTMFTDCPGYHGMNDVSKQLITNGSTDARFNHLGESR